MERRLIDANAIHGECNSDNPEFIAGWNALAVEIDQAPTIDAVEVVRCNLCKFYEQETGFCYYYDTGNHWDGFCNHGVRRGDDGTQAD